MAVADGLLPSPGRPSWLVGVWGPKTSLKSVSVRAPAFTVDAVPIPPGGALNPILNWIGAEAFCVKGVMAILLDVILIDGRNGDYEKPKRP